MRNLGLSDGIIESFTPEQIEEIVYQYKANPDNVSVSSEVVRFDVAEAIQAYSRASYEKKVQMGLSDHEIQQLDARLAAYQHTNITRDQEGGITPEEMEFSLVVVDYSGLNEVKYRVFIAFNWLTTYYWDTFQDKITVAWGGGLLQQPLQSSIVYYDLDGDISHNWNSFYASRSAAYTEVAINAGGYYYFDQSYTPDTSDDYSEAKRGNIEFLLSRTGYQNYETKILAQYFHQMLGVQFSMSITAGAGGVSGGIGITLVGTGDTSPQASAVISV